VSADELIRLASDVLFALAFVGSATLALRTRRRAAIDAALMFGSLGVVIVESEVTKALGISLPREATYVLVAVLLAVPFFFLRLVDDLTDVPVVAMGLAFAAFILSTIALIVTPPPVPLPVILLVILYFGGAEIYGGVLLVRESRRASGVPKRRAQAAALGSLLLGVTLLVAGAAAVAPALGPVIQSLTRVLGLLSALAYAAAITPPSALKRAWLEPQLREFLAQVASISPAEDLHTIARRLEDHVAHALGAARASILIEDDPAMVPFATPEALSAVARARAAGRPVLIPVPSASTGRRSAILAARMTARESPLGTLAVLMVREPLFSEDDLELVGLLADQAALVIDGARTYADLAAVNQQLQSATKAKSEFLANMSHELRTPMNAILGFSDLLTEQLGGSLTPSQQRYFRNIKDAGGHLLELINEVLDLSKVEAGRLDLRPEPVRIGALFDPVIGSTRRAAEAKGVTFEAAVPDDVVVRLDPGRIRQVLYNLLSNAVKFSRDRGRVALRARMDGQAFVIEVADDGIGIPADKRDRVFGTFERLHEGTVEASGTGLGLALTKKLVELHNGTIGFESEEGLGTTFRVRIADALFRPVDGARILVVEDTPADAELIAAVASVLSLPTEHVSTVSAGRDAAHRSPPLGIVLDLRLPDERGYALLEELKGDPRTKTIPVLVMSVEDDDGRSRSLGADDHLTKPIDRERLAAWIRKVAARPARTGAQTAA
jgi:signal transduction histidine kinase/ActR/RegA family two-component response regulator